MYRVELKDMPYCGASGGLARQVPNVPCGVESAPEDTELEVKSGVPNVPCGVERRKRVE